MYSHVCFLCNFYSIKLAEVFTYGNLSISNVGIWILYDETYYNRNNPGARSWWGWGNNFCSDVDNDFKNRAASLRLTGAPDDWKLDTINFYLQQNFIGDEFYTYGDKVSF